MDTRIPVRESWQLPTIDSMYADVRALECRVADLIADTRAMWPMPVPVHDTLTAMLAQIHDLLTTLEHNDPCPRRGPPTDNEW